MAENVPIEDSLKHLLKCNVCLEQVDTLKALPCQHTICLTCVKQLTVRRQRFKCTICKKENPVPEGGFETLPDSLLTKQISELIQKKSSESSEELQTQSTLKKEAQYTNKAMLSISPPDGAADEDDEENGLLKVMLDDDEDVKGIDFWELRGNLDHEKRKAERNYENAKEMVKKCTETLEKLPAQTEATKEAITEYKKKEALQFQQKIEAVDAAVRDISGNFQKKMSTYQPYLEKVRNAIDLATQSEKLLSAKKCPTHSLFADAQRHLADLKSVMADAAKNWTEVGNNNFVRGDSVRLRLNKECLTGKFKKKLIASNVNYSSIGIVYGLAKQQFRFEGIEMTEDRAVIMFPEEPAFLAPIGSFTSSAKKAKDVPFIGDKVRLKTKEVQSYYRRPAEGSHGVLKSLNFDFRDDDEAIINVVVEFADIRDWRGNYEDIELVPGCGFEIGDKVRASSRIPEPSTGWNGINGSSVGVVKQVKTFQGKKKVIVEFPENKNWKGLVGDLELVRGLVEKDTVQVKLSVEKPRLDWGGVTHKDLGTLVDITNSYDDLGKIAEVQFPDRPKWSCLLEELELARYQPPEIQIKKEQREVTMEEVFFAAMLEQMRGNGW